MPNDLARKRYIAEHGHFVAAGRKMEVLLRRLLSRSGVRADIEVRAKTVSSFVKKIHLKNYSDPWGQITDKVGGRIIVKTLDELGLVRGLIESEPDGIRVLTIEDTHDASEADKLSYSGIHCQVVVPGAVTSQSEPIECEVQLRTKAQDLWSVPSHELIYKGVVEPSKSTRRRVLRLSVLTEMFDEEVRLAMAEIAADPRYESALLLRAAESIYLNFVAEPGEEELSFEVLGIISDALPQDRRAYPDQLRSFTEVNRAKIETVLSTYGVYSPFAEQYAYWLFSQPESLVAFERIDAAPLALATAVAGTEIASAVHHLYSAWGAVVPDLSN
ncbi:MAG TPA: RelA/SpoT domain-containing protein [Propionicimonas sp.]|nr:RelA/SpoT domain-containing protein [Propionicimonas sp.]